MGSSRLFPSPDKPSPSPSPPNATTFAGTEYDTIMDTTTIQSPPRSRTPLGTPNRPPADSPHVHPSSMPPFAASPLRLHHAPPSPNALMEGL